MEDPSLIPRQARSRKALDNLLNATTKVLDTEGLDACTLPRVAAAGKFSSASVYRRFADKDALLRAVFLHVLEQGHTSDQAALEKSILRPTLEATSDRLVASLIARYRTHPRLLSALARFLTLQAGTPFAKEAQRILQASLELHAAILLHHRDRMRHPNPQRAALFAILSATSSIETALLEPGSLWQTTLPLSDKLFAAELSRSLVGYLRRKP